MVNCGGLLSPLVASRAELEVEIVAGMGSILAVNFGV
jgi:hypothetical protein